MTLHWLQTVLLRRLWPLVGLGSVVWLVPGVAAADPVTLSYEAPADCPSAESVVARISSLVKHPPALPVVARARISRVFQGYRLELYVNGGRRRIVSDSCTSLVHTLSVILSLAVEPRPAQSAGGDATASGAGGVTDPASSPGTDGAAPPLATTLERGAPALPNAAAAEAPRQSSSSVTTTRRPQNQQRNQPQERDQVLADQQHSSEKRAKTPTNRERLFVPDDLSVHPALWFWTEYGMLPRLANGPSLGAWFDFGRWSLGVAAKWLVPEWVSMRGGDPRRGGHLSFLGGEVLACGAVVQNRLVGLCIGVEAGDLMGKGSGVTNTRLGHGVWLAGSAEVGFRPRFWSKMSGDVRFGVALPVKRPAFGIDGFTWRYEPHGWSLRLVSGFSWF